MPMYMLPNPNAPKKDDLIAGRRDKGVGGKEWNAERHWNQLRDPVVPILEFENQTFRICCHSDPIFK